MKNEMISRPRVSVCCITYNHAEYIEDALHGFLHQKTEFPYEVIIHDDDSTDGTKEILQEYEKHYPEKLRVLYEEHNRFHEINDYLVDVLAPAARGEYIAFCEGDDYWIDDTKLQRQYNFLETNSDYSFCFHNAIIMDFESKLMYQSSQETKDRAKSLDELIIDGGGLANCTGSYFFRKTAIENPLPFLRVSAVGDYPWMFTLALRGKVHWMAAPMLVYRHGHPNSWTANDRQSLKHRISRSENNLSTMRQFDADTEGKYRESTHIRVASIKESLEYDSQLLAAHEKTISLSAIWNNPTLNYKRKLRFSLARILNPKLYARLTDLNERHIQRTRQTHEALKETAFCERLIREYWESQT
jgi:glycosyltransferase involved in cell wall biosynthesis